MQSRITCKKIILQKSIEFGITLKYSVTHYKQKQKYFLPPDQQLAENLILGKKRDKSEFVNNFVKITVTIIFI